MGSLVPLKKWSQVAEVPGREGRRMSIVCPKCAHRRGSDEVAPEGECPRCGVIYEKYRAAVARRDRESAAVPAEALGAGPETPLVGSGPGVDLAASSGPGDSSAPEAPGDLPDPAIPPDLPIPEAPTPWLRYIGLAASAVGMPMNS